MSPNPSARRLINQRVRNHTIEYLELAASYELQVQYERDVPIAHVPSEIICQWEDLSPVDRADDALHADLYSVDEAAAIREYHSVWNRVADQIPSGFPTLKTVQTLTCWDDLRQAAISAGGVFKAARQDD